jgi:hypothetical protein
MHSSQVTTHCQPAIGSHTGAAEQLGEPGCGQSGGAFSQLVHAILVQLTEPSSRHVHVLQPSAAGNVSPL